MVAASRLHFNSLRLIRKLALASGMRLVLRQSANHVITARDNQIRHMLTKPWDNSTSQDICQFGCKDLTDLVGVKMEISEKILKYY